MVRSVGESGVREDNGRGVRGRREERGHEQGLGLGSSG